MAKDMKLDEEYQKKPELVSASVTQGKSADSWNIIMSKCEDVSSLDMKTGYEASHSR